MKNIKGFIFAALIATAFITNAQAQSKELVTQEAPAPEYKKGDVFQSKEWNKLTLISERKIQGLTVWKAKQESTEGKTRTLYVPVSTLAECVKISNQNEVK